MRDVQKAGRKEWLGLAVLALPTLLLGMDFTVLHLAVPALSVDLAPSSTQMLWITDVYGFMVAGFLVTMGTLGDRIGRRRLLLVGATAFGVASVLAAFSPTAEALIVTRALLGVAGATLMPSTLSLIRNMFLDAGQRRVAIAVWMTNFMTGGAIGPVVGGALLERFWWGSVFLLSVPAMLLLLALGPLLLPEYRDRSAGRVDPASVLLSLAAMLPVVYAVKRLAESGAGWQPLVAAVAGVVAGAVFVRRQRTLPNPLLDLSLFTRRPFTVSLVVQTASLFVLAGSQFLVLQYLQLVAGLPALTAGLWTVPAMVAGVAGTLLAPVLARWLRPGQATSLVLVLALPGLALLTQAGSEHGLAFTVVGFTVLQLTVNPAIALSNDQVIASAPPERAGTASGVSETGNELGLALGVAVLGSVGVAVYRNQLDVPAGVTGSDAHAARDTLGGAVDVAGRLPGDAGSRLLETARDAFTSGLELTAVVSAVLLAALAAGTASLLGRRAGGVS